MLLEFSLDRLNKICYRSSHEKKSKATSCKFGDTGEYKLMGIRYNVGKCITGREDILVMICAPIASPEGIWAISRPFRGL